MTRFGGGVFSILLVLLVSLLLATFTTHAYVAARGMHYLAEGNQILRHRSIIEGQAGDPWQYRVLSAYLIEGFIHLLNLASVPSSHVLAFIGLRFILDSAIFLAAFVYFRRLGVTLPNALIGILLFAWGVSYSHYDSDLQFSTFFDILFYLLAGIAMISGRTSWIFVITALAALNRETSGLIPFMYLSAGLIVPAASSRLQVVGRFVLLLALYLIVFVGLRMAYGDQTLIVPHGHAPGLALLGYNLFRSVSWWQCLATLSVIPVLACAGYSKWPTHLRVFFWTVVPAWFLIHLVGAVIAETRLLLVPQVLVFIPGLMIWAQQSARGEPLKMGELTEEFNLGKQY